MALIKTIKGKSPKIPESCYLSENATIIGEVEMGEKCSVWYQAVVRGDVHYIKIGKQVNIQDGAIIHCTYQKRPTTIGDYVSIGHRAIIHGCTIKDRVLVGMGAIIMDACVVESNVIVAAGAVVTQGMHLQSNGIYAGVPAKRVKELSDSDFANEIERISTNYVEYASWQE